MSREMFDREMMEKFMEEARAQLESEKRRKHDDKCCDKCCDKHDDKCCDKHDDKCCDKHDDKHCDKWCDEHVDKWCDKHDDKHNDKHDDKCCDKHCDKWNPWNGMFKDCGFCAALAPVVMSIAAVEFAVADLVKDVNVDDTCKVNAVAELVEKIADFEDKSTDKLKQVCKCDNGCEQKCKK